MSSKNKKGEKYYVTTPIYYVNSVPHIGHAYTTIATDVLARWNRLIGRDVFFLTGTDEHGQKVAEAAEKEGKSPQEFVDSLIPLFKKAWKKLNISYDRFIRTTDKDHVEEVKKFTEIVFDKGDIYKGYYEGWYCVPDETFLTETQLIEGRCPTCNRTVKKIKEESYFFRLSKYRKRLLDYYKKNPDFIQPESRKNEIIKRVEEKLKDLSISRINVSWGVKFPMDTSHTVYVWFDALTNYLTGIGYLKDEELFKQFWPATVHVMAKEILWFHCVIWPAMLMSVGLEIPKKNFAHGWLTVDGNKMSKSVGNVVDPISLCEKYGADAVRFFLLKEIPFGKDGDFSEKDLVSRINSELADDLGNLVMRLTTLIRKFCKDNIPHCDQSLLLEIDKQLIKSTEIKEKLYEHFEKLEFHLALNLIWRIIRNCNKYIQEQKPWAIKDDSKRRNTILYVAVETLRLIGCFLLSFMPVSATKILKNIGQISNNKLTFQYDTAGEITESEVLFKKIEFKIDPFASVLLRVAVIDDVDFHPSADKLYVLKVSMGSQKRQLVAGIKKWYTKDDLKDKKIIVVSNLKFAKLRGVESQGMLLAAEKDGIVKIIEAKDCKSGDIVTIKGIIHQSKTIKIEEFLELNLKIKNKEVMYKDQTLITSSGKISVDMPDESIVR